MSVQHIRAFTDTAGRLKSMELPFHLRITPALWRVCGRLLLYVRKHVSTVEVGLCLDWPFVVSHASLFVRCNAVDFPSLGSTGHEVLASDVDDRITFTGAWFCLDVVSQASTANVTIAQHRVFWVK